MTEDTRDLAAFGYKQVLDRTLGSFSSFAAKGSPGLSRSHDRHFSDLSTLGCSGVEEPAFYLDLADRFPRSGFRRPLLRRAGGAISPLRRRLPMVAQDQLARVRLDGRLGLPLRLGHQPGGRRPRPADDTAPGRTGVSTDR